MNYVFPSCLKSQQSRRYVVFTLAIKHMRITTRLQLSEASRRLICVTLTSIKWKLNTVHNWQCRLIKWLTASNIIFEKVIPMQGHVTLNNIVTTLLSRYVFLRFLRSLQYFSITCSSFALAENRKQLRL